MTEKKIINTVYKISDKRGNGLLRREVWVDGKGQVTRYNLAYINHNLASAAGAKMNTVTIKIANVDDFFQHGRRIAQLADQQMVLPNESSISFEDPADLHKLLAIVDELELATSSRHHER